MKPVTIVVSILELLSKGWAVTQKIHGDSHMIVLNKINQRPLLLDFDNNSVNVEATFTGSDLECAVIAKAFNDTGTFFGFVAQTEQRGINVFMQQMPNMSSSSRGRDTQMCTFRELVLAGHAFRRSLKELEDALGKPIGCLDSASASSAVDLQELLTQILAVDPREVDFDALDDFAQKL